MLKYGKIISQLIDDSGKYRYVISVIDDSGKTPEKWINLKFHSEPKIKVIIFEAEKQINLFNNPPLPEVTIEELMITIIEKDELIASKDLEISTLKDIKVVK